MSDRIYARDDNFVPITSEGFVTTNAIAFNGTTEGTIGDRTIFKVTGAIMAQVIAIVGDSLGSAGAAKVKVGVNGSAAGFLAQTAYTSLTSGLVWSQDNSGNTTQVALAGNFKKFLVAGDIIQNIATEKVSSGSISYSVIWTPLTSDGNLVAA